MSVVGFDVVGHQSIEILLAEIEDGPRRPGTSLIPTGLVVRENTGRYASPQTD